MDQDHTHEPSADPRDSVSDLTNEALNHLAKGDRDAANAAFARRDAVARKEAGENLGSDGLKTENEEQPTDAASNYDFSNPADCARMLSELPGTAGELGAELVEEWGGPDSPTFKENLDRAMATIDSFDEKIPGLKESLSVELTGPGGETIQLGNDPVVLKLAALIGRELAGRGSKADLPQAQNVDTPPPRSTPSGRSAEAVQADIDAMIAQAPPGTRKYTDPKFQKRLSALFDELTGGRPIVGTRMRTI